MKLFKFNKNKKATKASKKDTKKAKKGKFGLFGKGNKDDFIKKMGIASVVEPTFIDELNAAVANPDQPYVKIDEDMKLIYLLGLTNNLIKGSMLEKDSEALGSLSSAIENANNNGDGDIAGAVCNASFESDLKPISDGSYTPPKQIVFLPTVNTLNELESIAGNDQEYEVVSIPSDISADNYIEYADDRRINAPLLKDDADEKSTDEDDIRTFTLNEFKDFVKERTTVNSIDAYDHTLDDDNEDTQNSTENVDTSDDDAADKLTTFDDDDEFSSDADFDNDDSEKDDNDPFADDNDSDSNDPFDDESFDDDFNDEFDDDDDDFNDEFDDEFNDDNSDSDSDKSKDQKDTHEDVTNESTTKSEKQDDDSVDDNILNALKDRHDLDDVDSTSDTTNSIDDTEETTDDEPSKSKDDTVTSDTDSKTDNIKTPADAVKSDDTNVTSENDVSNDHAVNTQVQPSVPTDTQANKPAQAETINTNTNIADNAAKTVTTESTNNKNEEPANNATETQMTPEVTQTKPDLPTNNENSMLADDTERINVPLPQQVTNSNANMANKSDDGEIKVDINNPSSAFAEIDPSVKKSRKLTSANRKAREQLHDLYSTQIDNWLKANLKVPALYLDDSVKFGKKFLVKQKADNEMLRSLVMQQREQLKTQMMRKIDMLLDQITDPSEFDKWFPEIADELRKTFLDKKKIAEESANNIREIQQTFEQLHAALLNEARDRAENNYRSKYIPERDREITKAEDNVYKKHKDLHSSAVDAMLATIRQRAKPLLDDQVHQIISASQSAIDNFSVEVSAQVRTYMQDLIRSVTIDTEMNKSTNPEQLKANMAAEEQAGKQYQQEQQIQDANKTIQELKAQLKNEREKHQDLELANNSASERLSQVETENIKYRQDTINAKAAASQASAERDEYKRQIEAYKQQLDDKNLTNQDLSNRVANLSNELTNYRNHSEQTSEEPTLTQDDMDRTFTPESTANKAHDKDVITTSIEPVHNNNIPTKGQVHSPQL